MPIKQILLALFIASTALSIKSKVKSSSDPLEGLDDDLTASLDTILALGSQPYMAKMEKKEPGSLDDVLSTILGSEEDNIPADIMSGIDFAEAAPTPVSKAVTKIPNKHKWEFMKKRDDFFKGYQEEQKQIDKDIAETLKLLEEGDGSVDQLGAVVEKGDEKVLAMQEGWDKMKGGMIKKWSSDFLIREYQKEEKLHQRLLKTEIGLRKLRARIKSEWKNKHPDIMKIRILDSDLRKIRRRCDTLRKAMKYDEGKDLAEIEGDIEDEALLKREALFKDIQRAHRSVERAKEKVTLAIENKHSKGAHHLLHTGLKQLKRRTDKMNHLVKQLHKIPVKGARMKAEVKREHKVVKMVNSHFDEKKHAVKMAAIKHFIPTAVKVVKGKMNIKQAEVHAAHAVEHAKQQIVHQETHHHEVHHQAVHHQAVHHQAVHHQAVHHQAAHHQEVQHQTVHQQAVHPVVAAHHEEAHHQATQHQEVNHEHVHQQTAHHQAASHTAVHHETRQAPVTVVQKVLVDKHNHPVKIIKEEIIPLHGKTGRHIEHQVEKIEHDASHAAHAAISTSHQQEHHH
jgi:hypothetical protein